MDTEVLQELGLSEKEIKVYIAGLKLGLANVSAIADKAGLARTTTHDLLKSLKDKGLAGYVIKGGVRHFIMTDPEHLLKRLEEKERKLARLLPELEELQRTSLEKPEVEFYHGLEGFKTVSNDLIKEPDTTIYAYIAEKNLEYMHIFHIQFRRKRKEKNINVKVLTERTALTLEMKRNDRKMLRQTRFLDKVMKKSNTSFFIYGDKIAHIMATEKEQLGIITKNADISELHRKQFEVLWGLAER